MFLLTSDKLISSSTMYCITVVRIKCIIYESKCIRTFLLMKLHILGNNTDNKASLTLQIREHRSRALTLHL